MPDLEEGGKVTVTVGEFLNAYIQQVQMSFTEEEMNEEVSLSTGLQLMSLMTIMVKGLLEKWASEIKFPEDIFHG